MTVDKRNKLNFIFNLGGFIASLVTTCLVLWVAFDFVYESKANDKAHSGELLINRRFHAVERTYINELYQKQFGKVPDWPTDTVYILLNSRGGTTSQKLLNAK